MLRGKIHRFLQGSTDHAVQPSGLYYAGIEEEGDEGEDDVEKLQTYCRRELDSGEVYRSPQVPNGHAMGAVSGAPCVGEVELNREGGIKIPCTLQHNNTLAVVENQVTQDLNGTEFLPKTEPKKMKDSLLYRFNMTMQDKIVEGNSEDYQEEESSAIIEHILKELRGINKIQEEISDLREYLSSVRGSVDEVSSCVDAVLMEIECMRSGTKSGVETWPATSHHHKSNNSFTQSSCKPCTVESSSSCGDILSEYHVLDGKCKEAPNQGLAFGGVCESFRSQSTFASPEIPKCNEHIPSTHETPIQRSDASQGIGRRKLSFGYLERQDGQDCPSTSSLSSGQSSKSESDPERLTSGQGNTGVKSQNWNPLALKHNGSGEIGWSEDDSCARQGSFEECCIDEVGRWDPSRAESTYTIAVSDQLSGKHYNSPSSTCSGEDLRTWKYDADMLPEESGLGYHQCTKVCDTVCFENEKVYALSLNPTDFKAHLYESCPIAFNSVNASCIVEPSYRALTTDRNLLYKGTSSCNDWEPDPSNASNVTFNVKKFGRAVFDFKTALRGALKKVDGTGEKVEINPPISPCGEQKPIVNVPNIKTTNGEVPQLETSLKTELHYSEQPQDFVEKPKCQEKPKCENVDGDNSPHQHNIEDSEHSKSPELDLITSIASDTSGHLTNADLTPCYSIDIIPQCLSHEELSGTEELRETLGEESQTPTESSSEVGGSEGELSQKDARRLKCLRSFQQILREKRESRRHFSMVTMSTFSEEDLNAGTFSFETRSYRRVCMQSS